MTTEQVVIGLDDSDGARRAVDWVGRTLPAGARITAIHVLTYSHEFVWDLTPATTTNWRAELDHDLRGPWTDALRAAGHHVRTRVIEDDTVAHGLATVAEQEHADLLVVGSHGRSITERVRGSVSATLAQQAPCPVVVVPPGWRPSAAA